MAIRQLFKERYRIHPKVFDMKKIFFVFVFSILYLVFSVLRSYAAPTPTASSSAQELLNNLQDYLSKHPITEKRGILGKATDTSDTQIAISDVNRNIRFVDVDELTKFISSSSSSFGISDIKKGDTLGIVGLYNKESQRILARAIYEEEISSMIHGNIAQVDSQNFVVNVATDDNDQFQVSVERTTRTLSYDSVSQNLIRSGFSRLKAGEKIFVRGTPDSKNDKLVSADTIIVFPDILKAVKPEISPSVVPSTGSGKKLTPIIK